MVSRALTGNAQAYTGQSLTPGLWNRLIAFFTERQAIALRQLTACALHCLVNGIVNLFLYCALTSPTCRLSLSIKYYEHTFTI